MATEKHVTAMKKFNLTFLTGIVACLGTSAVLAGEFYVSPTGDDAQPGTQARPFATLARARDAIRERQPLTENVVVRIAPGTYLMRETLELNAKESAPEGKRIVYQAADPAHQLWPVSRWRKQSPKASLALLPKLVRKVN